jgi:O-antigen/teichoic acid export membrane protein
MKDCCQKNQQDFKAPDTGSEKRIARNTIYLYIRTFVMMIVSLYTSRITLQVLGEEDFGIYNLVAGFVVLFGFLNYAM